MGAKYKHALRWLKTREIATKLQDVQILKNKYPRFSSLPHGIPGCFGGTGAQIVRGSKSATYNIYGDFPEYTKIATKKIYNPGRFINQSDIDRHGLCIGEPPKKNYLKKVRSQFGNLFG